MKNVPFVANFSRPEPAPLFPLGHTHTPTHKQEATILWKKTSLMYAVWKCNLPPPVPGAECVVMSP